MRPWELKRPLRQVLQLGTTNDTARPDIDVTRLSGIVDTRPVDGQVAIWSALETRLITHSRPR